jgi:small lipoprotein (TIGR04452 family)
MIKAFVFFIHLVVITNCIVLDKLDLSVPESVTGKEARDIIVTAAIRNLASWNRLKDSLTNRLF